MSFLNKLNSSHKFNKGSNSIKGTLKIIFVFMFSILSLIMLVTTASEDNEWGEFLSNQKKYIQFVKHEEEEVFPDNPNGSANGLNLLLINNITTEQYAKEYLTLAAQNYEGKLNSHTGKVPVDLVLALSVNESGTYDNTPLPISYLPWDSSSNSPHWNKAYGNIPAEAMTLSKANKNVLNHPFINANGPVQPHPGALTIGAADKDNSVTPFQINIYSSKVQKPEWRSTLNGYNAEGRTETDLTFFPDQLTYLSSRYSTMPNYVDMDDPANEDIAKFVFSWTYNPGSGSIQADEMEGHPWKSEEGTKRLKVIASDLQGVFEKYGTEISKKTYYKLQKFHFLAAIPLVKDFGWKIKADDTADMLANGMDAWEMVSGNRNKSEFENFVKANTENFDLKNFASSPRNKRSGTGLQKKIDGMTIKSDSIAIGHAYTKGFIGKYVYATMLKYAGVGIDPTNPDDYMNSGIPEGEWVPSSTGDFLKAEGVDPSKLSKERLAVINKAYEKLGAPYIWGGHGDVFNDKATYVKYVTGLGGRVDPDFEGRIKGKPGYDCSGFTRMSIKEAHNVEIGRTTYNQVDNKNLTTISKDELKPGDLIVWRGDTDHVGFFINHVNDKTIRLLHSPSTGDNVKIGNYPITNKNSSTTYRRLNIYKD